jgi:hypothetical protein
MGAVRSQAAKWPRPGKRDTVRTSPMTAAAMTGPAPMTLAGDKPSRRCALVPSERATGRLGRRWMLLCGGSMVKSTVP